MIAHCFHCMCKHRNLTQGEVVAFIACGQSVRLALSTVAMQKGGLEIQQQSVKVQYQTRSCCCQRSKLLVLCLAYMTYFKEHLMRTKLVVMVLVQYRQCLYFQINFVNIFAGGHITGSLAHIGLKVAK